MTMADDRRAVSGVPKAVEVSELTKVYTGNVRALDRLTLSVDTGTIYALLGPNGAGKTTTISILTTLISPTDGSARINGMDVVRDREEGSL